jgi:hypothetical protein
MPRKAREPNWQKNDAKKLVLQDLWSGEIPLNGESTFFLITVDGVHCHVSEPKHPTQSKNPWFYSHKFNQAGVDYELGIPCLDEWPVPSWRP